MEKMNYQKPDMRVVKVRQQSHLLAGSPQDPAGPSDPGSGNNNNNPSRALSAPGWSDNE